MYVLKLTYDPQLSQPAVGHMILLCLLLIDLFSSLSDCLIKVYLLTSTPMKKEHRVQR